MSAKVSAGAYSQRFWPGIGGGSLDDCVILADFRAAHAQHPELTLPSIATYRARAGVPDFDDVSNGLSLDDSMEAIAATWPGIAVERWLGSWEGFAAKVKAGAVASVSVLSSKLPTSLRYGFNLNHRITVYWNGSAWRILNPLAPPHSRPQTITESALRAAMAAYPTAEPACAVLFLP